MSKLLIASLFFCCPLLTKSQEQVKKYVQNNIIRVSTIEPDSTNFSDLEKIGDAIGNASIVMLGEQDHGDAPTFLAKTRLIKYLHEKKGFNVLAFESDFFGINYNWQFVKAGKVTVDSFVRKNISPIWTYCNTCNNLFYQYIPSTLKSGQPLEITGFDNIQGTQYLLPKLDSELQRLDIAVTKRPDYKSHIVPLLTTWYKYTKDSATTDTIISYYQIIKEQLISATSKDDFWVQAVENLIQENLQFRNRKKDFWAGMNIRDKQMASNLKWLTTVKYAGKKMIVWAHSYHVSKYSGHYPDAFANGANTMGTIFTADSELMKQTYIIGFSSYEGTAGRLNTEIYKVDKPATNGFENWINKEYKFAFVDFRKFNNDNTKATEVFYMTGATLGNNRYHSSYRAEWNKIFDGVFYIREMYPCKR